MTGVAEEYLIYDKEERQTWEVIIVLPGVEIIPNYAFKGCRNVKTVIMRSDTVQRIERFAFSSCTSLEFVKLSTTLEYIGEWAFCFCSYLNAIFIPKSCRKIDYRAFEGCKKLVVFLNVRQHTQFAYGVIAHTALLCHYNGKDTWNHKKVISWIKSMNQEKEFELHCECSSCDPSEDIIYGVLKERGFSSFHVKNKIGISAYEYLRVNPYFEFEEQKLINKFVL